MPDSARPAHPFDPLTAAEIEQAVALVRADGRLGERVSFWGAVLDEAHARSVPGERRVRIVVTDHAVPAAWEVDVVLGAAPRRVEWRPIDHRRPGVPPRVERRGAGRPRRAPRPGDPLRQTPDALLPIGYRSPAWPAAGSPRQATRGRTAPRRSSSWTNGTLAS